MAEVSQRAVGAALSRRTHGADRSSFDLSSWQGLTAVLAHARQSHISDGEYARFRDTVLAYAQSGGNQTLRAEVMDMLQTFGVTSEQVQKKEHATEHVVSEQVVSEVVAPVSEKRQKPSLIRSRPQPRFVIPRGREPIRTSDQKGVVSVPESPTESVVVLEEQQPQPIETEESPVVIPISQEQAAPSPVSLPPEIGFKTLEEHKRRIAEIKHEVNTRVGNPMLLVNAGNPIGREYMAALLAALKAAGGGGNINTAMAALEGLYQKVITFHEGREVQPTEDVPEKLVETNDLSVPTAEIVTLVPELPEREEAAIEAVVPPVLEHESSELVEERASPVGAVEVPIESEVIKESPSVQEESVTPIATDPVSVDSEERDDASSGTDVQDLSHVSTIHIPPVPEEPVVSDVPSSVVSEEVAPEQEVVREVESESVMHLEQAEVPAVVVAPVPETVEPVHPATRKPKPKKKKKPAPKSSVSSSTEIDMLRARLAALESVPKTQSVAREEKQEFTEPAPVANEEMVEPQVVPPKQASHELDTLRSRLAELQQARTVPSEASSSRDTSFVAPRQASAHMGDESSRQNRKTLPSMVHPNRGKAEEAELGIRANTAMQEQALLNAPEVTEALIELLNEWSLFGKSGLFGMGPGGMEHPLYEQLSKLPMSSVVSGRFEHVTPDTLQSIKDYVIAWQHEQGVSYLQSETFEHYLRRVVLRILKRQQQYA